MQKFFKPKILIAICLAIFLAATENPQAKAQAVPTGETNPTVLLGEGDNTRSLIQDLYEWSQTFVLTNLKRQLLDLVVDQTVSYIQGGGKPQFVTDWQGFLEDAGQAAVGEFAKEVGLGFLCSPFNLQIQLALLPVQSFTRRAQCTLNTIVSNIEDFYNDFRNGGWIAYGTSFQPQNNFFGTLVMVAQELELRKEAAALSKLNEALAGGGFLSSRDEAGNIITPGKTIGDALTKAVGSDIDFILSADQLGEYVGAISNALINRIIKEGVTGLQSAASRQRRDEAASLDNTITGNNFDFAKNAILNQINQTLSPRQQANSIIDSAITSLNGFKTNLNSLLNSFNNLSVQVCPAQFPLYPTQVNVANTKAAISAEIAEADNTISQLQAEKANNQLIINELLAAKSQIEPLTKNNSDIVELTSINNSIANILDPSGAENFKTAMEDQNNAINENISSKLAAFNQQLQQCQSQP